VDIEITDDDTTAPVITYIYTGDYTDENPGELLVTVSDVSGLSVDPSGTYLVPNSIGIHEFVFTAIDADNDRDGDSLENTITVWIEITDDDEEAPIIILVNITTKTIHDYDEFINFDILSEDISGICSIFIEFDGIQYFDDDRDNQILIPNPKIPGLYNCVINILDADNDRQEDQKLTQLISSFEVFDDDATPPQVFIYYDGFTYQFFILDNDGIFDSKATGEYVLINGVGEILDSGIISAEEKNSTITIPLKPGIYTLIIHSTNNDNEWDGDEEFTDIILDINVDIENCFLWVNKLAEDLINYVEENLWSKIANNIRFKLRFAQGYLGDAYTLVKAGYIGCSIFKDMLAQAIIEFIGFETEFYNKINLITDEEANYVIKSLNKIRNFIILLIGNSVDYVKGIDYGYDIAVIEVELLILKDYVEETITDCNTNHLEKLLLSASMQLELAMIKIALDIDPDLTLLLAKNTLDLARDEVIKLSEQEKISQDVMYLLLEKIEMCYVNIEDVLNELLIEL
jgi:hypothetical protein